MEKIDKIQEKAVDWWGKHNITTRTVILTILFLIVGTVVLSWLGKDIKHFDVILEKLIEAVLWLTAVIIAGVNGAPMIVEKILEWKKKGDNDVS